MSNTLALLVHAFVFACLFALSAAAISAAKASSPCVVSAPSLNVDAQATRVANVESSATVQLECASAPEPGNHTNTIAVMAMH